MSLNLNLFNVDQAVGAAMSKYQYNRLYGMQAKVKVEDAQISAYGGLKALFSTFQSTLNGVANSFNAIAYQASSSDSSIVSGSITNNKVGSGSHTVNVTQLAQSQNFNAQVKFASKSSALGINSTLVFTNNADNTKNYSVSINSGDSLETIRDRINNTTNNIGVTASIVASTGSSGTEYNLVLSTKTGAANQITITGDTSNNFQFNQTQAALDAQFTFDGYNQVRSSNVVDDVVDGLSLTIGKLGSATLTTSSNGQDVKGGVQTAIQNMLKAYNQIINYLDANQNVKSIYTTEDKQNFIASATNDKFSFIKAKLQSVVNSAFNGTGDIHGLLDVGIKTSASQQVLDQFDPSQTVTSVGGLEIDTTVRSDYNNSNKFAWRLTNDLNSVKEYFTDATAGFNFTMNKVINDSILSESDGLIKNATDAISAQQTNLNKEMAREQDRLDSVRMNLIDQYARLNAMISKYQGLSDYLDKQYDALGNMLKNR